MTMQMNHEITNCTQAAPALGALDETAEASSDQGLFYTSEVPILLIDGDKSACKTMAAALGRSEFKVEFISDPALIEPTLRAKSYQLILMDYVVPGVEWSTILDWISESQPEASIIVVTAYPSIDSVLECLRTKPTII